MCVFVCFMHETSVCSLVKGKEPVEKDLIDLGKEVINDLGGSEGDGFRKEEEHFTSKRSRGRAGTGIVTGISVVRLPGWS